MHTEIAGINCIKCRCHLFKYEIIVPCRFSNLTRHEQRNKNAIIMVLFDHNTHYES